MIHSAISQKQCYIPVCHGEVYEMIYAHPRQWLVLALYVYQLTEAAGMLVRVRGFEFVLVGDLRLS